MRVRWNRPKHLPARPKTAGGEARELQEHHREMKRLAGFRGTHDQQAGHPLETFDPGRCVAGRALCGCLRVGCAYYRAGLCLWRRPVGVRRIICGNAGAYAYEKLYVGPPAPEPVWKRTAGARSVSKNVQSRADRPEGQEREIGPDHDGRDGINGR